MRSTVLLLALVGCSQSPAALRFDGISVQEERVPPIVTLKITNIGAAAATIDRAAVTNFKSWIIAPPPAKEDGTREVQWRAVLLDNALVTIAPGATAEVRCEIEWVVDPNPPPMLAIVETEFVTGPDRVTTKPLSFVLQSQPGLLDAECNRPSDPAQDKPLLETLQSFGGQRSDGLTRLLNSLEARQ